MINVSPSLYNSLFSLFPNSDKSQVSESYEACEVLKIIYSSLLVSR